MLVRTLRKSFEKLIRPYKQDGLIPRHSLPFRAAHWFHLLLTAALLVSGLQFYFPIVGRTIFLIFPIYTHRISGIFFLLLPLPFFIFHRRKLAVLLSPYLVWRRTDLLWLFRFPGYFLFPNKVTLPQPEEKINAGQKLMGGLLIVSSLLMAVSGFLRLLGHRLPPVMLIRAQYIHQITFLPFFLLLLGHVIVGSGIHPKYKGIWRSMLGGGSIRTSLVREHWPVWLQEVERCGLDVVETRLPPAAKRRLFWAALIGTPVIAGLFLLSFSHPLPWESRYAPRADRFPDGIYATSADRQPVSFTVEDGHLTVVRTESPLKPAKAKQALIRFYLNPEGADE